MFVKQPGEMSGVACEHIDRLLELARRLREIDVIQVEPIASPTQCAELLPGIVNLKSASPWYSSAVT